MPVAVAASRAERFSDPAFEPVGVFPFPSSDHRLVWIDLAVGPENRRIF
jgi:hypothetical protein